MNAWQKEFIKSVKNFLGKRQTVISSPEFSHVSLEKLVSLVFPEISVRAFSEEASSEVKQEAYSFVFILLVN